jgi:hypothetical protein
MLAAQVQENGWGDQQSIQQEWIIRVYGDSKKDCGAIDQEIGEPGCRGVKNCCRD